MKKSENQSLWTSVILHVAVLIGVFLTTIVEAFLPKEKPFVFEMVSEPSSQSVPDNRVAPIDPPPNFEIPDAKPLDIPDPVMPEPAPTPPPPTPTPVPVKPTPVKPAPKPEPVPVKPKLMSLADFRKDNPQQKPTPPKPQPVKPSFEAPTINTQKYSKSLQNNLPTTVHNTPAGLTSAERSALQLYGDQLNSRLNRAWLKPSNLAGVGLTVTVVFDVSSSGRISNVSLRPSSGNSSFDASVKAAFTRVGSGGVTPTGQAHTFTMSFKMVD